MSDRDPIAVTRETYAIIAERYFERTRDRSWQTRWLDAFAQRAADGGRVCDVGAGPGYDAADLRARGRLGASVPADDELALTIIDEYIRFPSGGS